MPAEIVLRENRKKATKRPAPPGETPAYLNPAGRIHRGIPIDHLRKNVAEYTLRRRTDNVLQDGFLSFQQDVMPSTSKGEPILIELKYAVRVHEGKLKMKLSEEDFRATRVKLLEKLKEEVEKREGKEKEAIEEGIQEWSDEEKFGRILKYLTQEMIFSRFTGM